MIQRSFQGFILSAILVLTLLVSSVAADGMNIVIGDKITSPTGATTITIHITDANIAAGHTIVIDLSELAGYIETGSFTTDNFIVTDNATLATWTYDVDDSNILTLTSTGGRTLKGEMINLTMTGGNGNPWVPDSWGNPIFDITAIRDDGWGDETFQVDMEIFPPPVGTLAEVDGAKITIPTGETSPVITIEGAKMVSGGTITIDCSPLTRYATNNTIIPANFLVTDNAAAADWTGTLAGNTFTLISSGGATAPGENVTVTFTGGRGNTWIANTGGEKIVPLTVIRTDSGEVTSVNFIIETGDTTLPPVAEFNASPTSAIAPLVVQFRDTSTGNPTSWRWDFGDDSTSTLQNPVHTYSSVGRYDVTLTVINGGGTNSKVHARYIAALNGGSRIANTTINGLTISDATGQQKITVDTAVLSSALVPNTSVLEVYPPADRGWSTITFFALDGVGFSRIGGLISGNVSGVRLITEEIKPPSGFSNAIGSEASFNTSIALGSFPCNATLNLTIWEGVILEDMEKLRLVANGNSASVMGTAYTTRITRTDFPDSGNILIHMSVNSSWNPSLLGGLETPYIWRISDDRSSGEIFPTQFLHKDSVKNLDYYEVQSLRGYSTFGLSSLSGNNNPFQLITFSIAQVISPPVSSDNTGSDGGSASGGTVVSTGKAIAPAAVQNVNPPKVLAPPDTGKTEKIYANANGVITQATQFESTDQFARISIGLGVVAKDSTGAPLSSVTLSSVPAESLPSSQPPAGYTFTNMAYDFAPDGATFSPAVSVSFIYPEAKWGEEYSVKSFDPQSGTWQDLPTTRDPNTGRITAKVTHFCCIALFAKSAAPFPTSAVTPLPVPQATLKAPTAPAPTAISNFVGMMMWIIDLMAKNVIMIVGIIIIAVVIFFYGRKRRRDKVMYLL